MQPLITVARKIRSNAKISRLLMNCKYPNITILVGEKVKNFLRYFALSIFSTKLMAATVCNPGVALKTKDGQISSFNSISEALSAAPLESTIVVGSGIYDEKLRVNNKENLVLSTECNARIQSISFKGSKFIKLNGFSFEPKSNGEDHITVFENNHDIIIDSNDISSQSNDGNRSNGVKVLVPRLSNVEPYHIEMSCELSPS